MYTQVCPPGLHNTLGIFLQIFGLRKDACHQLDLSASLQGANCGPSYERVYMQNLLISKQRKLKDEVHMLKSGLVVLEQILTFTAATSANAPSNPLFTNLANMRGNRNMRVYTHISI